MRNDLPRIKRRAPTSPNQGVAESADKIDQFCTFPDYTHLVGASFRDAPQEGRSRFKDLVFGLTQTEPRLAFYDRPPCGGAARPSGLDSFRFSAIEL
jgi:hypothetical protein